MNDTPQGDGNLTNINLLSLFTIIPIRMNDTPQGDGNGSNLSSVTTPLSK